MSDRMSGQAATIAGGLSIVRKADDTCCTFMMPPFTFAMRYCNRDLNVCIFSCCSHRRLIILLRAVRMRPCETLTVLAMQWGILRDTGPGLWPSGFWEAWGTKAKKPQIVQKRVFCETLFLAGPLLHNTKIDL